MESLWLIPLLLLTPVVFCALDESRAPTKPLDVTVESYSDKAIIRWKPPRDSNYVAVRGYTFSYDDYQLALSPELLEFEYENLDADTNYNVSVRAYNDHGDGDPVFVAFRTLPEAHSYPSKNVISQPADMVSPVNLEARVISPNEVSLSWQDISFDPETVTQGRSYSVRWGKHNPPFVPQFESKVTKDLSVKIGGLKPNTEYEFSVKTIDENQGESPFSSYTTAKTFADAPTSAPYAFKLIENDNEEILNVTWKPPAEPNGLITGYELFYTNADSQTDLQYWQKVEIVGTEKSYVVRSVASGKPLYLKMRALNEVGPGPFSQLLVYQNTREPESSANINGDSFVIRPNQKEIRKNEGNLLIVSCESDSEFKNSLSAPLTWYFSNGSEIGSKQKYHRVHSTAMSRWKTALYFNPLTRSDTGSYYCGLSNMRKDRKSVSIQVSESVQFDPSGCTFEVDDMCGWLPDPTGLYEWKWIKAGNFSEGLALIIPRDHTMFKSSLLEPAGHYMYLQAVDGEKGSGRLISPLLPASLSHQACLSFWYFVGDGSNGKLFVQIHPKDSLFTNMSHLDEIDLQPTGREWREFQLHLKPQTQDFRVVLEAVKDPNEELIVAIDDVLISNTCKDTGGVKCE